MAAVNICSDFGALKNKIWHCFHCFPIYFPWSDGTGCHDLRFLNVEFSATLFTLLFHFHQEVLISSSLSAIRVVSSAYLRLLIFLPAILITVFASSSPAFHMVYSAHEVNKQDDNIQPWHAPFPIWNQSVVPCPVLTVVSWPAYRFLKRHVRGLVFHLFQNFPVYCDPLNGFGIVNKAEIDCFSGTLLLFWWSSRCWQFDLWFLCLF